MLGPVKDEDLAIDGESGNNVGVLGLVAGLVDLARVVDLLGNLEADGRRLSRRSLASIATNLATLLVVIAGIGRAELGNLNLCNLEVIRLSFRSMSANQQTVDDVVLVLRVFDIRKPLGSESGPFQGGAAGEESVIQPGGKDRRGPCHGLTSAPYHRGRDYSSSRFCTLSQIVRITRNGHCDIRRHAFIDQRLLLIIIFLQTNLNCKAVSVLLLVFDREELSRCCLPSLSSTTSAGAIVTDFTSSIAGYQELLCRVLFKRIGSFE